MQCIMFTMQHSSRPAASALAQHFGCHTGLVRETELKLSWGVDGRNSLRFRNCAMMFNFSIASQHYRCILRGTLNTAQAVEQTSF